MFDGVRYSCKYASELRDYLEQIACEGPNTLICWDAPLTGPVNSVRPGSCRYDFTKRPIERFFSLAETGLKAPKGISVLGYGACPHWTISRSLVGLPTVGPYDVPESQLPFALMTRRGYRDPERPMIVETHPALAAWLWCREKRKPNASWVYKGKSPRNERRRVWQDMWKIILEQSEFGGALPCPQTDDEFDAAVGYVLGTTLVQDEVDSRERCTLLGSARDGAFLVPYSPALISSWDRWRAT